jgi:crotonobetainyl-CoA:carnitine CoA-transferase CaiB-like acyl-CoA transferase
MLLADLGADVIKVESPQGDPMRTFGPFRADDSRREFGGSFQSVNRNKRSIVIDLKEDSGRQAFLRLVAYADVVVENFRAGVMERLGISYERLRERNPRLVYASIRGFGDPHSGSPHAHRPALDLTAQAMGGLMGITGPDSAHPTQVGAFVGDVFPGMFSAVGILGAVHHAKETGVGQYVDVSMYDAVLALCYRIVSEYSCTGRVSEPHGNWDPVSVPYGVFETRDGHVAIAASFNSQWPVLAAAMGQPELGRDERYATEAARTSHADEVYALVSAWTREHSKNEIEAALANDLPVGPVNTAQDIFGDPHVAARQMLVEVEQPGSPAPVAVVGVPIKLSVTPGQVRSRAPRLGEHTDEVFRELEALSTGDRGGRS